MILLLNNRNFDFIINNRNLIYQIYSIIIIKNN